MRGLSEEPEVPGWRSFVLELEKARERELGISEEGEEETAEADAEDPASEKENHGEKSLQKVRALLDQASA